MPWSPDRHARRGRVAVVSSRPDIRRYFEATRETGRHADLGDYR
jgi:hypothetical protein